MAAHGAWPEDGYRYVGQVALAFGALKAAEVGLDADFQGCMTNFHTVVHFYNFVLGDGWLWPSGPFRGY